MTRKTLLAGIAAASLFTAFAAHAAPTGPSAPRLAGSPVILVSDHDHGRKGELHGDHEASANGNCASSDDDGDDDEDSSCGNGASMMNQNASPPANGLISPGSTPKAQVN